MTSTRSRHADVTAPRVDWPTFADRLDWRQGEHVSLVGPTGQGKSTLGLALLPRRDYVAVLATKPKDSTLDRMTKARAQPRYALVRDWDNRPPIIGGSQRLLVWPKFTGSADIATQADVMHRTLDAAFAEGAWCLFVDELYYLCEMLGLTNMLRLIWQQGRSLGISLVGATQRPAWVPLELYSQATHVFLFRHNDRRDLDRLGGIASAGDVDPATIRAIVAHLGKNQFLYVNTRTGEMLRSRVET